MSIYSLSAIQNSIKNLLSSIKPKITGLDYDWQLFYETTLTESFQKNEVIEVLPIPTNSFEIKMRIILPEGYINSNWGKFGILFNNPENEGGQYPYARSYSYINYYSLKDGDGNTQYGIVKYPFDNSSYYNNCHLVLNIPYGYSETFTCTLRIDKYGNTRLLTSPQDFWTNSQHDRLNYSSYGGWSHGDNETTPYTIERIRFKALYASNNDNDGSVILPIGTKIKFYKVAR